MLRCAVAGQRRSSHMPSEGQQSTPSGEPTPTDARARLEQWRETAYRPPVAKHGERLPAFTTSSGIEVEPLYTAEQLAGWNHEEALSYPGEYPFTRGIQPTMYRGRLWTMRQYAGFGTPADCTHRYQHLPPHCTLCLSLPSDLPTQ